MRDCYPFSILCDLARLGELFKACSGKDCGVICSEKSPKLIFLFCFIQYMYPRT